MITLTSTMKKHKTVGALTQNLSAKKTCWSYVYIYIFMHIYLVNFKGSNLSKTYEFDWKILQTNGWGHEHNDHHLQIVSL